MGDARVVDHEVKFRSRFESPRSAVYTLGHDVDAVDYKGSPEARFGFLPFAVCVEPLLLTPLFLRHSPAARWGHYPGAALERLGIRVSKGGDSLCYWKDFGCVNVEMSSDPMQVVGTMADVCADLGRGT